MVVSKRLALFCEAYHMRAGFRRNPPSIPRQTLKWPAIQGRVGLFQPVDRYVPAVDPVGARRR
jgi:hypothetical protein